MSRHLCASGLVLILAAFTGFFLLSDGGAPDA